MPAVVRVKRRIDEEPLGTFVLNGKKRRLDGELAEATTSGLGATASGSGATSADKDEISTILKFAGTIPSQDDSAISQLARLTKEEARELVQQKSRKPSNHTERARQEMRQSLHENRFRVVNCLRTTLNAVDEDEVAEVATGNAKEITIVDIEKHVVAASDTSMTAEPASTSQSAAAAATTADIVNPAQPSDSDTGYVYDLYLPENEQQAAYVDLMDDNYLSVRAFDDLVYEDRFNNDEDEDYDSEDSNQENHAGNEYPDEEDDDDADMSGETEDARHMRHAVEKFVFCDDDEDEEVDDDDEKFYDQSSEDEDCVAYSDPYVHSVNVDEDERFVDDVDFCDVDRYGLAYARYKARVLKRLKGAGDDNDDDDDEDSDKDKDSTEERYHSASENAEYFD